MGSEARPSTLKRTSDEVPAAISFWNFLTASRTSSILPCFADDRPSMYFAVLLVAGCYQVFTTIRLIIATRNGVVNAGGGRRRLLRTSTGSGRRFAFCFQAGINKYLAPAGDFMPCPSGTG